jgi:hypothetical protein
MSVVHIVNSLEARKIEAAQNTNQLLRVLNGRFEEAFKTGISDEDLENG